MPPPARQAPRTPREIITRDALHDEADLVRHLIAGAAFDNAARHRVSAQAAELVRRIRADSRPGLMEVFLAEYGLSTQEGIALMCLAEALLRVPDAPTIDALIEDKIAPSDWGRHLGRSASPLVNASTWALMLTGRVLEEGEPGIAGSLRALVRRMGEPVIRGAVTRAMKEMGRQFVLGQTIDEALTRAKTREANGFTHSYDMLGEAARTKDDAERYHRAYADAIRAISSRARGADIAANPGISIKLSALHPRYEEMKRARVMRELVPRVRTLARAARDGGLGLNIDAEEAERLVLSLDVMEAVLADPALAGWHGFGIVVQAYGRRAGAVIDWAHDLAARLDRRLMMRLVKGAYWDGEIKRAQVLGLASFPVFTRKQATDVSYIANARKLLGLTDRLYPQFATHNAHTVAAVLDLARAMGVTKERFEFQRLHGMGERLHDLVMAEHGTRCRIYAPVGAHRDLLAYLVRRLLENGANSSFVNQIVNSAVTPEEVAADPFAFMEGVTPVPGPAVTPAGALFPDRANSRGFDLADAADLERIEAARAPFAGRMFDAAPIIAGGGGAGPVHEGPSHEMTSPATGRPVGRVRLATPADINGALAAARPWDAPPEERSSILLRAADLYEANFGEALALLAREAGKTLPDAVAGLREACDFLRYYAGRIPMLAGAPCGVFACISPWNFPIAIFTGQIAAALAAGNGVIAKPAEQTPLIGAFAVRLLHRAGVPKTALQLLLGAGDVGAALVADPRTDGVAFTGSTETAHLIRTAMADHLAPGAPLVAETGGLNAMIVDSTALPEQAVRDVIASSFQSAGQRCSALRCLYVQEEVAPAIMDMLGGALRELTAGDPWELATDIGPVIDRAARDDIRAHMDAAAQDGRLLCAGEAPGIGTFVAPCIIRLDGIDEMKREVFGPVLHVVTWPGERIDDVLTAINATGYGLTFGLHTRIDDRVEEVVERLHVGNIYVNRNQIGAVVGSQPFGGEGMSGTGPKAGGPAYLARFTRHPAPERGRPGPPIAEEAVARALAAAASSAPPAPRVIAMPGPTGESNRLHLVPRPPLLCLGPGERTAAHQVSAVRALGGRAVPAPDLAPDALTRLAGFSGALWWGDEAAARAHAQALAARPGPILPLVTGLPDTGHVMFERHVCIDTTASGGNAKLLVAAGSG